jgi:hypothetical protein
MLITLGSGFKIAQTGFVKSNKNGFTFVNDVKKMKKIFVKNNTKLIKFCQGIKMNRVVGGWSDFKDCVLGLVLPIKIPDKFFSHF